MCHVSIIREYENFTLFEIYFDGDDVPYRVMDDTQEHAEAHARSIANVMQWIDLQTDPNNKHIMPK